MAQSSRPRSDSSVSTKRKYQRKVSHAKSSRLVKPTTPRVLDSSDYEYNAETGKRTPRSSRRQNGDRRAGRSSQRGRSASGYSRQRTAGKGGGRSDTRQQSNQTKRSSGRKKHGAGFRILIICGLVVLLASGFLALYYSNLFVLTNIKVSGNEKLQSDYLVEVADVPSDSTFLRTDTDGIKARLLAEPWIQDVSIVKTFPDTLTLSVTEQPIAAVVNIVPESAKDSIQQWIISEDGTWITQVNTKESTEIDPSELVTLPKIKDISAAVRPEAGVKETDEGITNALKLLAGFSDDMRSMVAIISAPDAASTMLTLYNNVSVAFGPAEDIEAKEQAIATLLDEKEGTLTSINVRVPDRPTHRSTG